MVLSGILLTPIGLPYKNESVRLTARETSVQVLKGAVSYFKTSNTGTYSVDVPFGRYTVELFESHYTESIGSITVDENTTETDINSLIILEQIAVPTNPLLQQIRTSVAEANTAAASAVTQATSASTSASNAASNAVNASSQATNASASAIDASASKTSAASSAASAITSATSAASDAAEAAINATTAFSSKVSAANSASNAATSEVNSAGSASIATTKAAESVTSETNSSASANSAATSAANAGTSATTASAAASSASSSQTASASSAATSVNSATAASASATSAAASASNAASAATTAVNAFGSTLASSQGAKQIGHLTRTVDDSLTDLLTLKDFASSGTTDFTTAVNTVESSSGSLNNYIYIPPGVLTAGVASSALRVVYDGPGQLKTGSNKRGKTFTSIGAAPTSLGVDTDILTAFNGDWSAQRYCLEHRVTGTATLGVPTTGYQYTNEACPIFGYMTNTSGHNQSLTTNDGRTAVAFMRVLLDQNGSGDAPAYNARVRVGGFVDPSSTSWLANPAGSIINGSMGATADYVYLNSLEFALDDGGYDVTAIGPVINLNRTVANGAHGRQMSTMWHGMRVQSTGAASVDTILSGFGKFYGGLDFSMPALQFQNQAAILLKQDDRIYFASSADAAVSPSLAANTRATNGLTTNYLTYDSSTQRIRFNVGGVNGLSVYNTGIVTTGDMSVGTGKGFIVNGTRVITDSVTGWTLMSGTAQRAVWDTSTVTLATLAQTVKALIDDLYNKHHILRT